MIIYCVMSREKGLISVWYNEGNAEDARTKQYNQEEFAGGRPSVWVEPKELN